MLSACKGTLGIEIFSPHRFVSRFFFNNLNNEYCKCQWWETTENVKIMKTANIATEVHDSEPITIIRPTSGWISIDFFEIWKYRELLLILAWRNTIVRYKQSVIGIAWAIIRPVTSMVVFSIIFGNLAKLPSDGVPYPIFTFVALIPWGYFSGCLTQTGNSLIGGGHLIKKVYFPRLILPLSHVFTGFVDFCISFVVLMGMMIWYRDSITLTWGVFCLPLFLILTIMSAFSMGLWFCSFMVKYRDIGFLIPYILQVWLYITPVAYTAGLVPEKWRLVYALNPMASVIDGFRWALLGKTEPHWGAMALSSLVITIILITGLLYFKRTERTFADVV